MTECAGCGDCCENLPLNTPERADIYGKRLLTGNLKGSTGKLRKMAAWMANLTVVSGPFYLKDSKEPRYRYSCPVFDPVTRRCTDHANRPEVCRRYPHYEREPQPYPGLDGLSPRCSFNADHRTMLPIVAVSSGSVPAAAH